MAQRSQSNSLPASPVLASDRSAALKLTPVSRETEARLDAYVDLLVQWQSKHNLIAPSTLPNLWTRHIADSLQLLRLAPDARRWIDLGSGGGFPGVVIACAMAEQGGHVTLVERNGKKAAFLREALRVTGSPGQIVAGDIGDNVDSFAGKVDCVTARALASLDMLLGFTEPLITAGAKAFLMKGQDVEAEIADASKTWRIEPKLHASVTGGQGWIVELDAIGRRTASPTT